MADTTRSTPIHNLDVGPDRRPGRPGKRDLITAAARAVFGRDGYSRSSIDAIAAEAGVSTRTIYNHFPSKEVMFSTVLEESATRVADSYSARLAAMPDDVEPADLRADLIELARASADQATDFPDHFAMVRQINAEAGRFPPEMLHGWREAGPQRVDRELVARLRHLAGRGLLTMDDPVRAGRHFSALTARDVAALTELGARPLSKRKVEEVLAAGVDVFLHGYAD